MQIIDYLQLQPKQSKMCFVVDIFIANLHQDYSVRVVAKDFPKLNKDIRRRMSLIIAKLRQSQAPATGPCLFQNE